MEDIVCNDSFDGDPVTVGSESCESCFIQLQGQYGQDFQCETKRPVDVYKENIRKFFRDNSMRPDDLELIEPIIIVFGWTHPRDCVMACIGVLRGDKRIPVELEQRLRDNWA